MPDDKIERVRMPLALRLILYPAGLAVGFAAVAAGILGLCGVAAWFAFGDATPPFPWPLLRFFTALGVIIGAVSGLFAAVKPEQPA